LGGRGCKLCGLNRISSARRSNTEEFIIKVKAIHGDLYDYSEVNYTGNKSEVAIICKKHGIFHQIAAYHYSGSGCPKCSLSRGEKKVLEVLKGQNIEFVCQKTFTGCINKSKLKFDFYLPDYNLCIEYDGIQHYRGWWRNPEKSLAGTKRRDEIKNKFCEDNGIGLLRIPYFEFNNIEKLIRASLRFEIY